MSQQPNDEGLVPPIKVLRKRLNGVYSAEGLTGPTRRYVLLVVMLVGLASLPTLAAITAGSNELAGGGSTVTDVPFIPPASTGPIQVPPSSADSGSPAPPVRGQAQKRKIKPSGYAVSRRSGADEGAGEHRPGLPVGVATTPSKPHRAVDSDESDDGTGGTESDAEGTGPDTGDEDGVNDPENDGDDSQSDDDGDGWENDGGWGRDDDSSDHDGGQDSGGQNDSDDSEEPDEPDQPGEPGDPESPPGKPVRPPWCADRTQCSSRPSHHHRPDRSPHKQCEDANHRAHWSHHRDGPRRTVTVHIEPTGRHGLKATVTETRRAQQPKRLEEIVSHRWAAPARSHISRRSAMTERPQNVKSAVGTGRTHNSHRHHRAGDARSYRGSHRAEETPTAAVLRSSRPGRHHADHTNRW
ncbi:hypothetical protein AB0368_18815 [Actinoplanes sp. NPDC051475]|uniref:hypothetical protein n=1 Tax=Actinoplanes sp. NPDC051475 TaxID=3157225 RepID=UPI00344C2054